MLSLPVELQEQILDYLSRQDLLSLAQICKSVGFVASARLRSIVPNLDSASFMRCIRVLMADSARAAEILELNIAKCEFKEERLTQFQFQPPVRRSTFLATLKSTIRQSRSPPVVPLDDNTLPCDPPDTSLGPFDFFQALSNVTRLRKLVIHAPQNALLWTIPVEIATLREIYAHNGAESTPMLGWISYQPRINTLRVHCTGNKLREYRVHPPNSIFFPSLSYLTSNAEGAEILLPESAVEDLHIEGLEYNKVLPQASEGVPRLQRPSLVRAMKESHERTPLRRLTLTGDTVGIFKWLKALAEGGISIPHIRMVLVDEITDSIQILKWSSHAEDTMPLLSGLEILEIFNADLCQQHFVDKYATDDDYCGMERNKALMWGRKCPTLHTIRFPSSRWRIKREGGEMSVNREWWP